jgi:hypothetical protein
MEPGFLPFGLDRCKGRLPGVLAVVLRASQSSDGYMRLLRTFLTER